ncbi:hypothetical protein MNBD_GAMMA11-2880 [hydrothermal vent metagenome]|uniref:Sulphotransferase Stf0 domain-containing protein n=1 Tax=hydrothermal vent metagenome TaxID=652676 RepID=A0A3B0X0C5_9ZZZZ
MNIFILNTGRCGSTTFIKACKHINNYTSTHESLIKLTGKKRLAYPLNHIEADNRLSWFLGRLDQKYANNAFYVHLSRNRQQTTESFCKREHSGIIKSYKEGVLLGGEQQGIEEIVEDYIETVETNIALFLKDKTNKMIFNLENASDDFEIFWHKISARGDRQRAIKEWRTIYNASD